jgi:type I restriction enzyme S subunit
VPFALPPVVEQRRIAAILDKADEIRRKYEQSIAYIDQLLRVVFWEVSSKYKRELIDTTFGDLAASGKNTFSNGPFGNDLLTSELTSEGVPVVYIRDIRDGRYDRVSSVFVTEDKAKELRACSVEKGDVPDRKSG